MGDLRGQCYDGSSNMSGAKSGCRALVQEKAPLALYTDCAAHQLILAIVKFRHSKIQSRALVK